MPEPIYTHSDIINRVLQSNKPSTAPFKIVPSSEVNINGRYPVYFYGVNNEDLYAQNQTTGEKAWNGIVKMAGLASSTIINGTLGLANGIVEMGATGKLSSLYDNSTTRMMDEWNKEWEDKYAHYKTVREETGHWWEPENLFSANFLWDGIVKNFGFALGAAATGGMYSAALKGIGVTGKLIQAGKTMEAWGAMEEGLAAANSSNRLSSLLQSVNRVAKSTVSTIGRGVANNADNFITSAFSATGEAGLEALNNSQEFRKNLIDKFQYDYGRMPNEEELKQIDQVATSVGNWSFGLNLGLLTATQYIQLPKIFSSSTKNEIGILNRTRQTSEGFLEQALPKKGFAKLAYGAYKGAGLFFNEAEAFEEGAQFAIQKGTQDYYEKAYRGKDANFWDSLGEGVKETLTTDEGLLNVFLGGFSGAMMTSGFVGFKDKKLAIGKTGKIGERGIFGYGGDAAKNTAAAVEAINKTRFKNVIVDGVNAANRAITVQEQRVRALELGDVLESKDLEHDYTQNYLFNRIKYGKKDLIIEDVENAKNQASTDEGFLALKEKGLVAETDTRESYLKRLENLKQQANFVEETYNNLKYQYEGILNDKGERVYPDKVLELMTFAASKVRDYNNRLQDLQIDLQKQNVPTYRIQATLNENKSFKDGKIKEAFNQTGVQSVIREVVESIPEDNLNRDEIIKKLFDYTELLGRRQSYIKEYNKIKENPSEYKAEPEEKTEMPSYKTKEGKEVVFEENRIYKTNASKESKVVETENGWKLISPKGNTIGLFSTEKEALEQKEKRDQKTKDNSEITFLYKNPDGSIKVKNKTGQILNLYPEELIDYLPVETEAEKLAKNKKLKDKFTKVVSSLEDDTKIDNSDDVEDSEGFKIDISQIRQTSTDPRYETTFYKDGTIIEFNNYHRRHQEFLLNFSKNKKLKSLRSDIRIIPVTSKTEEFLKVKGLINPEFKEQAIRYIYVLKDGNKLFFINKEGDKIGEVTKDSPDLNEAIFTYARREDLTFGEKKEESYTNKKKYSEEQIKQIKEEWKQLRKVMLDLSPENVLNNLLELKDISRGLPNIVNSKAKNSVFDLGLITEEDLYKPIITVPVFGDTLIRGSETSVKMPLGKPLFNYEGNMFFLNNRNISDSEAENLTSIFEYLASQLLSQKEVDPQILYYISGVIKNTKQSGFESFYINPDYSIRIGNITFAIDQISSRRDELKEALKGLYHHVNYKFLKEFEKNPAPFRVYSIKDGNPEFKEYPTYQHYLLQGENPPLSTNLSTDKVELPIVQKYPILRFDNLTLPSPPKQDKPAPKSNSKQVSASGAIANLMKNAPKEAPKKTPPSSLLEKISNKLKADIAQTTPGSDVKAKKVDIEKIKEILLGKYDERLKDTKEGNKIIESAWNKIKVGKTYAFVKHYDLLDKLHKDKIFEITVVKVTNNTIDIYRSGYLGGGDIVGKIEEGAKVGRNIITGIDLKKGKEFASTPDSGLFVYEISDAELSAVEGAKTTKGKKGFFDSDSKFDGAAKRGIKVPISLRGDIAKEEAEVKQMLPNVNYVTLKNIIQTSGGLRAWGAALPNFIYVWENAPYGTRYHEAFEQVFNFILNTEEQLDLYNEFLQREGTFTSFEGVEKKFSEATFEEAKEQIADEFAAFKDNGTLPIRPKVKSFIQRLWQFLKSLFTQTETIENVFNKLAKGSYASSVVNTPMQVQPQFKREVVNTPESLVQDMISGMTAEIFMKKWQDDVSLLSQLEDNEEQAVKPLFDELYNSLEYYFTSNGDQSLYAYFAQKINQGLNTEEELLPLYQGIQQNWENVKAQWINYTNDLKNFLKRFDIAFTVDDEGNIQLSDDVVENEEEKLGGSDGYASEDRLFVNAKNSASKLVKLLFATIADSEFVFKETKNQLGNITKEYIGNYTNRDKNQMKLPSLAEYAKLFNYTLHNSANTNGIKNIINKLSEKSLDTNIKINANLQVLLKRIKYDGSFSNLDLPTVKLILKLENALTKQKPEFYKQLIQKDKSVVEVVINSFSKAQQLTDEWINSIQSSKYVEVLGNKIKFNSKVDSKDPLEFLNNLGIEITKEEFEALGSSKEQFIKEVNSIRESVKQYTKKPLPLITTKQTVGFGSILERLAKIYTEKIKGDTTESQHRNLDGKPTSNFILNNYVSTILNDLEVNTLQEFKELNPQFNDLYMGSSYFLNEVLFKDGERTNTNFPIVITEGFESSKANPHHKLTGSLRLVNEINNNLNNKYFTLLPADAKTPWAIKVNSILPKSFFKENRQSALDLYKSKMFDSLKNEIELAKDFENRKFIDNLNVKDSSTGIEVGKQLRFFKGILSKDLVKTIQEKYIDQEGDFSEIQEQFNSDLETYINNQAQKTINKLIKYKYITERSGVYALNGLDKNFLTFVAGKEKKTFKVKEDTLKDIFFYREANYIFTNMELHKLFFNDPAQYKDPLKRIKSFLSGREYTHSDPKSDLNLFLNKEYNKQGDYELSPREYGYYNHTNEFTALTIKDVKTYSQSYEDIKKAIGKKADKYLKNDVADAQSWATGVAFREMQIKSGARWEDKQEQLHQWLMAYERQYLLKKGILSEEKYSKKLQQVDTKILEKSIPNATIVTMKPIITGNRMEGNVSSQYLYKTSTAPLYLYFVEGTPIEKTYLEMMENNLNFLAMESAHKVGKTEENTYDLLSEEPLNSKKPVLINYKYFGIQVETKGSKKKVTQGSQLTKLAVQNLMSSGVPLDYIEQNKTLSEQEIRNQWTSLSEEEKLKSKDYSLFKRHNDALINLALERSNSLFKELSIKEGDFGYSVEDKKKVAEFVLQEISRRELPNNMAEGIEVIDNEFKVPLEANANYAKIKEILYSTIENNLTRPKTSGSSNILLSSLGFDNLEKKEINGKTVFTSTKYKFYKNKEGERICQVALPFMFGDILPIIEKTIGKKFSNPKEGYAHVLEYLNNTEEGKALLRGIGFRIPTQGLNSVDHFEIVEFLPPQMGKVAIFPSEITTKAGSDFDVDKINLYLKNFYLDAKGYPKVVPFFGYSEEAKEKFKSLMVDEELSYLVSKEGIDLEFDEFDFKKAEKQDEEEVNSLYLQSLENEYYDALGDIFSAERTFAGLVTPNDASQLEAISEKVKPQEVDSTNFSMLLDSDFMTEKRQTFLAFKIGVGVAAVSNTNLALNQLVNLTIRPRPGQLKRNFKIRFPHNQEGDGINFSKTQNQFGDWISDLNSQVIDGTVDVSKKEWLPEMLGNPKNLNILLFMFKAGIDPYTSALFLNQPSVKEFLVQREVSESASLVNPNIKSESAWSTLQKMQGKNISSKKKRDAFYGSKPEEYTKEMLESFIGQEFNDLSQEEKYLQLQILDDYYCFSQLAQDLFKVVQGYNIDTTRFTNPESVELKKLQTQEAYNLKNISGQEDITSKTFLAPLRKAIMNTSQGLSSVFNTQNGEAKRMLNRVSIALKTQFYSKDDVIKYLQKSEQSIIDYKVNQNAEFKGFPIYKWSKAEFLGDYNIAYWVKAMQYHPDLKNNVILQNIEAVIDNRAGSNSYLKLKENSYDAYTSDVWTAAFRELKDSGTVVELGDKTATASSLFQNIVISQILQVGMGRSKNSFLHIIPNEEIATIAGPALTKINNLEEWWQEKLFYRNNWQDDVLIPEAPSETVYDEEQDIYNTFISKKLGGDNRFMELTSNFNNEILTISLYPFVEKAKYKSYPFLKITELETNEKGIVTGKKVSLYKRVEDGDNPVLVKINNTEHVLFKRVNKLGNDNLKEYSGEVLSILSSNEYIKEIPDQKIIQTLFETGYSFRVEELSELIDSDEFEDGISEFEEIPVSSQSMQQPVSNKPEEKRDLPCEGGTSF